MPAPFRRKEKSEHLPKKINHHKEKTSCLLEMWKDWPQSLPM